jgi:transcriptional regulator with XRE-family HTH domain/quercetin dioxygenase-like cupin family protein
MSSPSPQHARVIGEKLRAARQERHMSLRELADKAEMSASMLSQIENGKAFPSVRTLYNIAAVLSVSVDYFFPEQNTPAEPQAASHEDSARGLTASEMREVQLTRSPGTEAGAGALPLPGSRIVHAAARPSIQLNGGVTWSRLTAEAESDAEFLEISYEPGAASGANMSHHAGREFGIVLKGELVIELGFETFTLQTGDSIIFDSSTPHRLANKGEQPMCALWVVLNQP